VVIDVADVSSPAEPGQSTDRDAEHRVGLGLLLRFIGAVFLVLLGGLLLLDRALSRANQHQASLDARSAALITETFIGAQQALLDHIVALATAFPDASDSTKLRAVVERALLNSSGVHHVWLTGADGRRVLEVGQGNEDLVDSLDRVRAPARTAIILGRSHQGRTAPGGIIAIVRSAVMANAATDSGTLSIPNVVSIGARAGLLIETDSLRALLRRTSSSSRVAVSVLVGADTLVQLGAESSRHAAVFGTASRALVRLPNGGTWTIDATHALMTRSLRWGMWTLGVMGVLFLALGLLREQRRAFHVAARSVELERLYSDVKRANQAKSEFLANVSHELRTPLNAIVGFVELLRDGFYGDLTPRQVPPVDRIAASATHLRHLVDQVLDIAKIAAGRLEVHSETIVLRPFVLNVASELESLVSEKGLALSITVGASLPRVRTDPTHLRQILINLIGNAVKYTPAGSVSVRARLLGAPEELGARTPTPRAGMDDPSAAALLARAPRSGIWIALQVIDTGVGIAATDLTRIFDEFEQVNAGPRGDSMQRGTGLGLAISRRLARLLGGDISVESVLGRGSTFTIWLPVSSADLARERPLSGEVQTVPTSLSS
jgi:signal transduction histidine kinase